MKRIAIFTPNFPPELGACSSRMQFLVEKLQSEGHQVQVYTTFPNYPKGRIFGSYRKNFFKKFVLKEIINNTLVFRFPIFPSNSSALFPRLVGMISLFLSWFIAFSILKKQKVDYIFVQSPPLLPTLTVIVLRALVSKKNHKISLILNVSDLYPRVLLDLGKIKGHTIYNFLLKFESFIYKKVDIIVGQSEEIVSYVKEKIPSQRVFLYRNGVKTETFKVKKDYKIPQNRSLRLVYAGLLGVAQGILELIKNVDFEKIGVELHLYGDGAEREKIENWLKNNHSKEVFLHEAVSINKIAKILAHYDVVLIAQKQIILGTVPSKIYEAMAAGVPILLCGGGESADLIRKYGLGLVVRMKNQPKFSLDYKLLEQEIRRFKEFSETQRKTFGENGRRVAQDIFDKSVQFQNIKKIFS